MIGKSALSAAVVCVLLATGCSYEKMVVSSQPGPPPWVTGVPEDTPEKRTFTGIALADNVLDERTARRRAMEDVREQIAASLATEVQSEAVEIREEEGAQHLGEDEDEGSYYAQLKNRARQALSGVRQEAYYWEKWRVKRGFFKPGYARYKYYVKASIPRNFYDRLAKALREGMATEVERR